MPRTVADLINDFLADVQPEDCRQASLLLLCDAIRVSGPVIHDGAVASLAESGDGIDIDMSRAAKEFAQEVRNGAEYFDLDKIPSDHELAEAWGLPTAASLSLPLTAKES